MSSWLLVLFVVLKLECYSLARANDALADVASTRVVKALIDPQML